MTEEICEPIEKNTEEEICIEVPSQKANKVKFKEMQFRIRQIISFLKLGL